MSRALATIALLILSNTFMTLAWYGHIAFKSKIERFGMLSIILLSWGIALFEYCFQVPANRIGNLSSVTDFSTFTQVLPRLSEQTWSVTDCGYNPTYQQMLDGETGAESK